jgi:23S rRNA pseudouridine2605 synthase
VNRLIRVSFGPFMLGDLEPGQIEEVKTAVLKDQLGPRLSRQLGVKREPVREERRLLAVRGKPAHLRPEPAARARRERETPDARPLKRRRILEEGGTGSPKIEFVPEERPRRGRFGDDAGPGRKPRFDSRRPDREDRREVRAPRFEKTARGEPLETRRKPTGERKSWQKDAARSRGRPEIRREGPGNPARDTGAKGPPHTPRDRKPFTRRKDAVPEDAQQFRPIRREGQGERQHPPRRRENAGVETARGRELRPDFERQGERHRPRRQAARAEENAEFQQKRRDGTEKKGERQRPSFRRSDEGDRKPFKARAFSGHTSGKQGGGLSGKPAAGKAPHSRRRSPPRKPGHRPGPEADKERP